MLGTAAGPDGRVGRASPETAALQRSQFFALRTLLLNYEWDSKALLSLVLVGLSDFEERLRVRRNRSLASRLHRRFAIDPITADDTSDYLRARLSRAGVARELFAADAVTILHEAAGGTLRELDRLATSCLRDAARKKRKTIERDVVSRVVKNASASTTT